VDEDEEDWMTPEEFLELLEMWDEKNES